MSPGEYGLESRTKEAMQLRAAAANVFQVIAIFLHTLAITHRTRTLSKEAMLEMRLWEVWALNQVWMRRCCDEAFLEAADGHPPRASLDILTSITSPPPQPIDPQFSTKTHFAALLLASLLQAPEAKSGARAILVGGEKGPEAEGHIRGSSTSGQFFVPADSPVGIQKESPNTQQVEQPNRADEDADDEASLMAILVEYLSLSLLVRSKLDTYQTGTGSLPGEEREWVY
jgi:hypothetical protein